MPRNPLSPEPAVPSSSLSPFPSASPAPSSPAPSLPLSRAAVLALACLLLGGSASAASTALGAGTEGAPAAQVREARPYAETRLFFGTARPDGGPAVTDTQFRAFVDEVVTPRFPDGLTVQDGYGQYRDAQGVIERERSYELVLYYPRDRAAATGPRIEQVRRAYTERFAQESVARVDDRARVDF